MIDRVEEIRRRHAEGHTTQLPNGPNHECDVCDLFTALAQAEREHQADRATIDILMEQGEALGRERDAARAEVERLKGHGQQTKPHSPWHDRAMEAEADLARVRAALDEEGCQAYKHRLGHPDDGCRAFRGDQTQWCFACRLRAALEGR